MSGIDLPVRYFTMHNNGLEDILESNTSYTEATWNIDPAESALVLVDFWTTHILQSHLERCGGIIEENIVPLLPAARRAGFTVIYGPGFNIAKKYTGWERYAAEAETDPPERAPLSWPPREFRRREGRHAEFARPFIDGAARKKANELFRIRRMPASVEPGPEDFVIASGAQLHRLLEDRKILHLLYLGFATNDCVVYKDYGIRAMGGRGYNIIILRDCTTGVENSLSLPNLDATKAALQFIELHHASATAKDLIRACG